MIDTRLALAAGVAASSAAAPLVAAAYAAVSSALGAAPYMDELFHVPQAQRWCAGRLGEYDPKITTLPGLYGVALLWRDALSAAGLGGFACEAAGLRALCAVLAVGCALAFALLCAAYGRAAWRDAQRDEAPEGRAGRARAVAVLAMAALAAATYPPHFFFGALFYTDVPGALLVAATYAAHAGGRPIVAAACGALAILTRQTNAVWVAFAAADVALAEAAEAAATKVRVMMCVVKPRRAQTLAPKLPAARLCMHAAECGERRRVSWLSDTPFDCRGRSRSSPLPGRACARC